MGILNTTPDSFYSGSRTDNNEVEKRAEEMISAGAKIIDIGGYSSRPGADHISVQEEIDRTAEAIELIHSANPNILISIDSFRAQVAEEAIRAGASIINDISGGLQDDSIFAVAAKHKAAYILMHMRGTPQNMQSLTEYENLLVDVNKELSTQIRKAEDAGITDLLIDPGFGFAKTVEQNYELMNKLDCLHVHDKPILVGISRKSMIYKKLGVTAEESLNGTTVLNTQALLKGAGILRVHDVKEAVECVELCKAIRCEESQ